jgi:hypothetical protein
VRQRLLDRRAEVIDDRCGHRLSAGLGEDTDELFRGLLVGCGQGAVHAGIDGRRGHGDQLGLQPAGDRGDVLLCELCQAFGALGLGQRIEGTLAEACRHAAGRRLHRRGRPEFEQAALIVRFGQLLGGPLDGGARGLRGDLLGGMRAAQQRT